MSNMVKMMRAVIASELADVYTTLPGEVVAYDGTFVTARPALAKRLANGEALAPPQVVRVPVCWPVGDVNGAQALISVPLTVNGPLLYTQGMAGEGGEGGASMRIRGGVAYEGGAITHNGKNIGDNHRHPYAGGTTEGPT